MSSAVILYDCVLTAVQNHLDTRRESIDASFDGVKEFLIGMNDRARTSVMAVKANDEYARVVWV